MVSKREPSWFDQVSPNLLKNRIIRNYLTNFSSKDLPEVVKLTLMYGIVNLHKAHLGKVISIELLRNLLNKSQVLVFSSKK
jgi:hypothetical protein